MILIVGSQGMLGSAIQEELSIQDIEYVCADIKDKADYFCDISDIKHINKIFDDKEISVIINCSGWTAVDDAEDDSNKKRVDNINISGLNNLYKIAKQYNCKLLHISSDYVFNGQGDEPWKEIDTPYNPVNYYGVTKLQGEKIVEKLDKYFIIRTQWLYGQNGNNFVDTMLEVAKTHNEVKVVNDQIGSPTYVNDLAKVIVEMIQTDKYGYYHVASSGDYVSWYEFCKEIYKQVGLSTKVIPVSTKEYGLSKAKRPHNSRLDRSKYVKCGFTKLPDWKESLTKYLKDAGRI